ncbi:MAG: glycosyltransferase family 4 protein [Myxococcota bacterium]
MTTFALILVIPWLIALYLTPLVERWAARHGWIDRPHGHKRHTEATPLLGGMAVFISASLGLGACIALSPALRAGPSGPGSLPALALGLALILGLGAYDDRRDLRAGYKLVGQILIAAGTWALGFRCGPVELPLGWMIEDALLPSFLVTILWIVVVTNAFNLIDGLDGLATGLGLLACLTIFVLASSNGTSVPVIGTLALAGALAGFLRYNAPPARIFLGDAGSMGIGYAIAVLSLGSYQKSPTAVVLSVPLIALGLPLLDTAQAILRRTVRHVEREGPGGLHPLRIGRALLTADRGHVHHLLVRTGWTPRRVLFSLYGLSGGLSGLALWTRRASPELRWLLWLSLMAGGLILLRRLQARVERSERTDPSLAAPTRRRQAVG